jgi:hypothetical protein
MNEEGSQQDGERADDRSPVSRDTMTRGDGDLLTPARSQLVELFFDQRLGS